MIILKFGGTSVSTKERILNICDVARKRLPRKPVIVVSALSGITDMLLSISKSPENSWDTFQKIKESHSRLIREIWDDQPSITALESYIEEILSRAGSIPRDAGGAKVYRDTLASFGETMSSYIVSEALKKNGIASEQVLGTEVIVTDDNFGNAEFLPEESTAKSKERLMPLLEAGVTPVVTGFIGATSGGKTTTLGRGGSDYSASILGYCLGAEEIEIWTDVDGILTADPRVVKTVKLLEKISYREVAELATFGAKVLHPKTIRPAMKAHIPVRVLNSFNPEAPGTLILEEFKSENPVTAVSSKAQVTLINICSAAMFQSKGFLARIFEVFSRNNISIDLVSVSEVSVSITLDRKDDIEAAIQEISELASVTVSEEFGMVSLIGERVAATPKNISRIFDVLDRTGILVKMISLGATDINVSMLIKREQLERAVQVLHDQVVLEA